MTTHHVDHLTAERITKGSKTFVRATLPSGEVVELGGKRAERAACLIAYEAPERAAYNTGRIVPAKWKALGVRADAAKGLAEANRLARDHTERYHGSELHHDGMPVAFYLIDEVA